MKILILTLLLSSCCKQPKHWEAEVELFYEAYEECKGADFNKQTQPGGCEGLEK